jgi:hypothetical protein
MMNKRTHVKSAFLAGLFSLMMVPVLAYAQTTPDSFMPSDKDMTGWVIGSIFGDWNTGSQVPMLGAAMQILNMFALTFGTLMFTYVAVIGTVNTAQDGEILGKKWSSMWIPLRFTAGTALLVPLASGYSTIQHFILWLALAGGGAASQVWAAAVGGFAGSQATTVVLSQDYEAKVQAMARDVLKAELCAQANQFTRSVNGTSAPFGLSEKPAGETTMADPMMGDINSYSRTLRWGALDNTTGAAPDSCGSVKTSVFTDVAGSSFQLAPSRMLAGTSMTAPGTYANGSMGDDQASRDAMRLRGRAFIDAQASGIMAAAAQLRPLARRMAEANPAAAPVTTSEIATALKAAATSYRNVILPTVTSTASSFDQRLTKFTEASKEAGWLMAGSTFFQMAQIRSAASKMMQSVPTVTAGALQQADAVPGVVDASLTADIEAMEAQIDKNFKGDSGDWWNPGEKLAYTLGKFVSVDPASDKHALVQIKDTGDRIIVATEVVATGMVAATTVSLAAGNSAPGKVVDFMSGVKTTALELFHMALPAIYAGFIACFGVGVTMAFVIPMLPFTLTIGSIVGWLMALFSAVVAGPVWLAGHLHPEGDDIAGKGIGGYMILLETVTRPIFIVFGLLGAFLIMDPVLKLVSLMFKANMSSLEGNSTTGIVATVVLAMLYAGIVFTTVRSTMTLVYVLSETVYRWIGGAHAGMEQAREFNHDAQGSASAATRGLQGAGEAAAGARMARVKANAGGGGGGGGGGKGAQPGKKLDFPKIEG